MTPFRTTLARPRQSVHTEVKSIRFANSIAVGFAGPSPVRRQSAFLFRVSSDWSLSCYDRAEGGGHDAYICRDS